MSLTAIQVRSDEEAQEVVTYTRRIMGELPGMPGFISFLGAEVGHRLMTITAWGDPEAIAPMLRGGAHREAMERFFGPNFALGGVTGVWIPHPINEMHVRCIACGRMQEATGQVCECGGRLPESPPYW